MDHLHPNIDQIRTFPTQCDVMRDLGKHHPCVSRLIDQYEEASVHLWELMEGKDKAVAGTTCESTPKRSRVVRFPPQVQMPQWLLLETRRHSSSCWQQPPVTRWGAAVHHQRFLSTDVKGCWLRSPPPPLRKRRHMVLPVLIGRIVVH